MILRNDSGLCLPNGLPLGTPYHLVEGHHRLGFLVAMNEDQPESVLAEHRIWVLEVDPGAVSHEWPNV